MTTQLFRSKSCGLPSPSLYLTDDDEEEEEKEKEKEKEEEEEEEEEDEEGEDEDEYTPISTPFRITGSGEEIGRDHHQHQFPILEILAAALKKSLITCSVEREDICSMDIGLPTDVRHVSHVTFDRFDGFLGLPVEFEPDLPRRVPSASVSVFGVSANSMQCSHDDRGNSVPVILLMMQKHLYSGGGLQAEGIFRINAENSQEDCVRDQLNKGIIPHGIDVHCLAGLIKAWFRELPSGVLDSLTPDQVMHCNNEEECTQLVRSLPPTEAGLLDWAINLMADVVHQEHHNKMNVRNIAMVFAPNMTQMADPLTALIHAVQVMNFLKTLIVKILREREESNDADRMFPSRFESPSKKGNPPPSRLNKVGIGDAGSHNEPILENYYHSSSIKEGPKNDVHESFWNFEKKREDCKKEEHKTTMGTAENEYRGGYGSGDAEGFMDKLSLRKGVKKLCRHRVFKLSKPVKKSRGLGIVNTREGDGEAWA